MDLEEVFVLAKREGYERNYQKDCHGKWRFHVEGL